MGNITRGYDPTTGDDILRVNGKLTLVNGKLTLQGIEIKRMPYQPDSTASDVAALKADFNALLQKLRDAGLMATS